MKKIYAKSKTISSLILFLLLISLTLVQCKKDNLEIVPEKQKAILLPNSTNAKTNKLIELTKEMLALAKTKSFVQFVFDECKIQKFGDYYVRIDDLLTNPRSLNFIPAKNAATISKLVTDLKNLGARSPIIFYPSVETKEKKSQNISSRTESNDAEVVGVVNDGNSGYSNYEYPGYKFNTDGQLDYYQQITEEFAWDNDVWVIGEEEDCSPENMVAAANDDGNPFGRFQGQSEYAGIIQVTNLGAIEPWISGKLEFKMTVLNSAGAIVLGPLAYGKYKRENFRNNKWKDFGSFVGNWNTSTFGNYMFEHWMEEDGGQTGTTTITMPPPPGVSGPTITNTIPSKNLDDDLGRATIQFTDAISQVYNISYANIKRKN